MDVVLPVVMLFVFERFKGGTDPRAVEVERHTAEATSQLPPEDAPVEFVPFPAKMVMISLYVLGAWMLGIGLWGSQDRGTLMAFAGVLAVLGGVVQIALGKIQRTPGRVA